MVSDNADDGHEAQKRGNVHRCDDRATGDIRSLGILRERKSPGWSPLLLYLLLRTLMHARGLDLYIPTPCRMVNDTSSKV